MRTLALLFLLVAGTLGLLPGVASAASMDLEAPSRAPEGTPFPVSASGEADKNGFVYFYLQKEDTSCPATASAAQNEGARPASGYEGQQVSAGEPYLTKANLNTPQGAATWTVCAYLSESFSAAPDAQASRQVTIVTDSDGDGLYDDEDRCPTEFGRDDRNGQKTADGCPIRDADRDGLRDEEDRCPSDFGRDERNGQTTADGCPIRDRDQDGVRDEEDRCPDQRGVDQRNGQLTADGCPVAAQNGGGPGGQPGGGPGGQSGGGPGGQPGGGPGGQPGSGPGGPGANPDADGDQIADAQDKCPQENANSGAAKKDPANPGCLESGFRLIFAETYFTFTGRYKPEGAYLTAANFQATGVQRAKSFKILVTLSKASAKKAKISKRAIASTTADVPPTGTIFYKAFKKPVPTAKTHKKLKKLKKVSFKYTYIVTLVNGETRTATESYTLKRTGPKVGNATKVNHPVFGPGTNAAGEEF